jgi:hypothetical protein
LWIGLRDADPVNNATNSIDRRAEFVWSSGEPVGYANWSAVEPNNYRERGEYYVHTLPSSEPTEPGAWVDAWDVDFNGGPLHGVAEVVPPPVAATRYVNAASPTPTAPYLTWETAAQTIQDAVDAANAGDTVVVTNGLYDAGVGGDSESRVTITKPITVQSVNGPEVTIIKALGRCVYVGTNSVLSGFTLTGGRLGISSGGGALCEVSAVVSNCVIIDNSAPLGGGVHGGTLYHCILITNVASQGGGGGAWESTLYNCTLIGNLAGYTPASGGGASGCILYECTLIGNRVVSDWDGVGGGADHSRLYRCTVVSNSATALDVAFGGGVHRCIVDDSILSANFVSGRKSEAYGGGAAYSTFRNCLLFGNRATGTHYVDAHPEVFGGGAAFCTLSNSTVAGNSASDELQHGQGGGVAGSTLQNCIVFNNSASTNSEYLRSTSTFFNSTFSYSCTTPLPDAGIGNIASAPGFVNPAAGDYHLTAGSPCIDAGYNLSGVITNDLDGNPRPLDGNEDGLALYDMGAYEFNGGGVHYVNAVSPTPSAPYLAWETAAQTIQDAVDAAQAGDLVLVTNGVYATGGRAVVGTMTNRVAVDKPLTLRSVNGPEFTVIQGYQVPGTTNGDGAIRCVYLSEQTTLSGFTLTHGATRTSGDSLAEQSGGGVWCEPAIIVVSNCVVVGNAAANHGGGAYSGGTFFNCTFADNWAGLGGGVGGKPAAEGWATLYDCTLTNNHAGDGGGARNSILYNCSLAGNSAGQGGGTWGCNLYNSLIASNVGSGAIAGVLSNCTLIGNSGFYGGGAKDSTVNRCTLIGNTAAEGGGAHSCTVTNSTLLYNSAGYGGGVAWGTVHNSILISNNARLPEPFGGGAYRAALYNSLLVRNDVWGIRMYNCTLVGTGVAPNDGIHGNTLVSCILPGSPEQGDMWQNCFNGDPKFVDPNTGNYHLSQDSPCIDAGLGIYGATDLDGNPRAMDGNGDGMIVPDIGAYEFDLRTIVPTNWFLSYGLDPADPNVVAENPDQDVFTTYQEWVADTDPTNEQSFFHIEGITASSQVSIFFQSSSNRLYTLRFATNLVPAIWAEVPGQIDVPGSGGMDALTDATNGAPKFYRLGVRAP